jgi:hypothetical protein
MRLATRALRVKFSIKICVGRAAQRADPGTFPDKFVRRSVAVGARVAAVLAQPAAATPAITRAQAFDAGILAGLMLTPRVINQWLGLVIVGGILSLGVSDGSA